MSQPLNIGIVGCGKISDAYFQGCAGFPILRVVACADLDPERAAAQARAHSVRALAVEELLADPAIDLVINLTIPAAHTAVSMAAIERGKHVYSEKPLALSREEARRTIAAAEAAGVRVGCAPDTVLGGGIQTSRKLIDDGWIGAPIAATAFMMGAGPESWHPNPVIFYQRGAGPLWDMGPYYLSALVHLLGPISRVTGVARAAAAERVATSEARFGERIPVEVPTHVAAALEFAAGPLATLITSFDIQASTLPRIEVYGSAGTLLVPDPNTFGGPVLLRRAGAEGWSEIPLSHSAAVGRGIGVADMAHAIRAGRPHRCSGELALHVTDTMQSIDEAAAEGRHVAIEHGCARPAALPLGLLRGQLDD